MNIKTLETLEWKSGPEYLSDEAKVDHGVYSIDSPEGCGHSNVWYTPRGGTKIHLATVSDTDSDSRAHILVEFAEETVATIRDCDISEPICDTLADHDFEEAVRRSWDYDDNSRRAVFADFQAFRTLVVRLLHLITA